MEFPTEDQAWEHINQAGDSGIVLPDPVHSTRPCWRLEFAGKTMPDAFTSKEEAEARKQEMEDEGYFLPGGPRPEAVKGIEDVWTVADVA